jgi:Uma2 family endonuclease
MVLEKIYTPAEYFALEQNSEVRHEYVHGNLITIPGESKIANKIALNCVRALDKFIETKAHEVFAEDVRLQITAQLYRYPDLVVAPESDKADTHAITTPTLIIEVLSESTQETDRTDKLREYCSLPTLQYYLLIAQDEYTVEVYRREGERWMYEFYTKLQDTIDLPFFEAQLPLQAVYQKVVF